MTCPVPYVPLLTLVETLSDRGTRASDETRVTQAVSVSAYSWVVQNTPGLVGSSTVALYGPQASRAFDPGPFCWWYPSVCPATSSSSWSKVIRLSGLGT